MNQRIPSLDGLRAISITLVILGHLAHWKHVPVAVLGDYGLLGVQVFFVLSGYLITNLLLREYDRTSTIDLREFYIRRAYRIFPAAFLFLAVVAAIYWREIAWYHIAAAVFYVSNMDASRPWMFIHLWSLSVEEQFYLIWPFAVKKWHRHKTAILLCAFWLTPFVRVAIYAFKLHYGIPSSLPGASRSIGDWVPAGHLRTAHSKNPATARSPDAPGRSLFHLVPGHHPGALAVHVICIAPDSLRFHRWLGLARHPVSLSRFELGPRRMAGKDQLRPISLAATILRQRTPCTPDMS